MTRHVEASTLAALAERMRSWSSRRSCCARFSKAWRGDAILAGKREIEIGVITATLHERQTFYREVDDDGVAQIDPQ